MDSFFIFTAKLTSNARDEFVNTEFHNIQTGEGS